MRDFARTMLSNKHCLARLFAGIIFPCFFLEKKPKTNHSKKAYIQLIEFIWSLILQLTDTDLAEVNGNCISVKGVERLCKAQENSCCVQLCACPHV